MNGQKVLVLGLAKSGYEAAKLLVKRGASVTVTDRNIPTDTRHIDELQELGVHITLGSHPFTLLDGLDFIVKNPGIPYTIPFLQEAIKRNIRVITEVELAYIISKAEIIGITGSNGKTTTTMLTHALLQHSVKTPLLAGNIGHVACQVVQEASEQDVVVTELSSFQLMGIDTFKPKVSIFLNLSNAHLDYHGDFDQYKAAKARLFENQTPEDVLIYNADDFHVSEVAKKAVARTIPFSQEKKLENGIYLEDKHVMYQNQKLFTIDEVALPGTHNLENVMAAAACALVYGVSIDHIRFVVQTFTGVKHRLQYVDTIQGVMFYNNSKSTNSISTRKAIEAFQQPLILLAGGLDRKDDFHELRPVLSRVKACFLYGETASVLANVCREEGVTVVEMTPTLSEATSKAISFASSGDVVLLSPACASWDQYQTFEHRGDDFLACIQEFTNQSNLI